MFDTEAERADAITFMTGALCGFAVGMLVIALGAGLGYLTYLLSN